jgi:hypothetical protein
MKKDEPQVGIFWLVGGKLLINSTPLSAAEPYGVHLIHPRSHLEGWTLLQRTGKVPSESEYEEFPRGRVIYGTKTRRFTLLADEVRLRQPLSLLRLLTGRNLLSDHIKIPSGRLGCPRTVVDAAPILPLRFWFIVAADFGAVGRWCWHSLQGVPESSNPLAGCGKTSISASS